MNYPQNTTHWNIGDLVLHDADAKEPRMFMRVTGYTREGLVLTKYIDPTRNGKNTWKNDIKYLHAPDKFGFTALCTQSDYDLVKYWNRQCSAREKVRVSGSCEAITFTKSMAFLLKTGGAWVETEDCGRVELSYLIKIEDGHENNGDGY